MGSFNKQEKRLSRILVIVSLLLSACATYQVTPLNNNSLEEVLKPPDTKTILVKARNIKHPILRPIKINLSDGLSPDEAAVIAVIVNPTLRAERDRASVARAQLLEAGLLPNPQLSFSMDIPSGGDTTDTVTGYGIGFGIDLRSLITRDARVEAAKRKLSSVNLEVAWKEWQVAEAAKMHLYHLYYLEKLKGIAKKKLTLSDKMLEVMKEAVMEGEKTSADLMDMETKLRETQTTLTDIDRETKKERILLNRDMGLPPDRVLPLQSDIKDPFLCSKPSYNELMDSLYSRPDILALKEAFRAEDARLRVAILSRFPDIGIGFDYSMGTDRLITIGPSITIDLPFFDHAQGRVAMQKATMKEVFDRYAARVFKARSDLMEIISDMGFIKKKLHTLQGLINSLKQQCQTYRELLKEGMTDRIHYYSVCSRVISEQMKETRLKQLLTDMEVGLEIVSGRYTQTEQSQYTCHRTVEGGEINSEFPVVLPRGSSLPSGLSRAVSLDR
ncbi:MAG: TolC family protein [Nitrospirae bacterium]|nr:TolC family protein [Nitrospirota bacterium]